MSEKPTYRPRCIRPGCGRPQTMTGLCTRHNAQEAQAEERWREKQRRASKGSPQ